MPRTTPSQWAALFNFAGGGLVHMELFTVLLMTTTNPSLFEAIAIYLQMYGLHADRPAAGDVPVNSYFFETDTETLFQNQANTWIEIASVGGGGSPVDFQVNGVSNADQTVLNFIDSASVTFTNPADGDVQATATGTAALKAGSVYLSGNQAISTSTDSQLAFDTVETNSDPTMWDTSDPTTPEISIAGLYLITMQVWWDNASSGTFQSRVVGISPAGAICGERGPTGNPTSQSAACIRHFDAGDTIAVMVRQTSGSTVNVTSSNISQTQLGAQLLIAD